MESFLFFWEIGTIDACGSDNCAMCDNAADDTLCDLLCCAPPQRRTGRLHVDKVLQIQVLKDESPHFGRYVINTIHPKKLPFFFSFLKEKSPILYTYLLVAMATWPSIKFCFLLLKRVNKLIMTTTSLASLPIELHDEFLQYLSLQDLHSARFINQMFYFSVTLFVLRKVSEQLDQQTNTITIIHKNDGKKILGSADISSSTATIPAGNIEFDVEFWRRVFFSLTLNGQVLKWVCPEEEEGMTVIKDKCRTVGGYRSNPKRVRMSMYLDLTDETPLPATPSSAP
jgi:hypothetical protein